MKLTRYLLGICLLVFSMQGSAFDELHLKRFKAINKCPNCDLSGADLSGRNMISANLKDANLSGANLSRAYLWSADLSGANLSGATLPYSFLLGANLSYANLQGAKLTWAVTGVLPVTAVLTGLNSNFQGANLSGADLKQFNAAHSDFTNADFVRRQIIWNTQRPDLREALVHLIGYIKRHFCGIASAGPSLF